MDDYKDLIAQLRSMSQTVFPYKEAADAIEKLVNERDTLKIGCDVAFQAAKWWQEELASLKEKIAGANRIGEGLQPLIDGCKRAKYRRDISTAVDRFLCWKLPKDFAPDAGISFNPTKPDGYDEPGWWPIGTNLFTDTQARAMFEHCLEGTGYVLYPLDDDKAKGAVIRAIKALEGCICDPKMRHTDTVQYDAHEALYMLKELWIKE